MPDAHRFGCNEIAQARKVRLKGSVEQVCERDGTPYGVCVIAARVTGV
jgi:hypothetical protein